MMAGRLEALGRLLVVAAITAVLLYLWQSQLVAPSGAADTAFSGSRALATLSRVLQEQVPHIAGSPQNALVRDRIVTELQSAGYAPEVQAALSCVAADRYPGCTTVENIVAVHKGTGGGKAVLATAHYDSVPAGPGTSDDGAGAAVVVELARIFAARQTRNDVIFLLTDGEETGLRGATAFAEQHPLMARVGAVVNVEARGASGPSLMFETGPGNAQLMDLFAKSVARPTANSVSYEVYRLLPNDTDFTVYRKRGLTGFNFAYSSSASLYHSQRDNLRYIDTRSLQHQGEHAYEVAAALADTDLDALKSSSDASYFDLFGRALVVWPAALNVPAAAVALLGILALIGAHRSTFSLLAGVWAVVAFVAVALSLFAVGWMLSWPLGIWPGVHPLDHPQPWPARVAIVAAAMLVAIGVAAVAGGRAEVRALLLVNWLVLAMIALAVAIHVPGASYPFVWPALGFAAAGWLETLRTRTPISLTGAAWLGFVLAAFFWIGFVLALELVLGFDLTQYKIMTLLPFALALVPLFAADGCAARIPAAICAVVVVGAAAVASQTPAYAPDHPRGLNVVYYDDKSAAPRWLIGFEGAPDEAYLRTQGFPARDEAYRQFGLIDATGRFKPAQDQMLPAPTLTLHEVKTVDGTTIARGTLRSGRSGFLMGIGFAPDTGVRSLRFDNQLVTDPQKLKGNAPVITRFWGSGARDVPIEISFDAAAAPRAILYERSVLPESGEARGLVAARPDDAAPVYSGDSALVFVTVDLAKLGAAPPR
jgi:hypothetical protein